MFPRALAFMYFQPICTASKFLHSSASSNHPENALVPVARIADFSTSTNASSCLYIIRPSIWAHFVCHEEIDRHKPGSHGQPQEMSQLNRSMPMASPRNTAEHAPPNILGVVLLEDPPRCIVYNVPLPDRHVRKSYEERLKELRRCHAAVCVIHVGHIFTFWPRL